MSDHEHIYQYDPQYCISCGRARSEIEAFKAVDALRARLAEREAQLKETMDAHAEAVRGLNEWKQAAEAEAALRDETKREREALAAKLAQCREALVAGVKEYDEWEASEVNDDVATLCALGAYLQAAIAAVLADE